MREPMNERADAEREDPDEGVEPEARSEPDPRAEAGEPSPATPRRSLVPDRPLTERGGGSGSLDWVHQFRVSPLALLIFLGVLAGLWALFEFTELWYVLFP